MSNVYEGPLLYFCLVDEGIKKLDAVDGDLGGFKGMKTSENSQNSANCKTIQVLVLYCLDSNKTVDSTWL